MCEILPAHRSSLVDKLSLGDQLPSGEDAAPGSDGHPRTQEESPGLFCSLCSVLGPMVLKTSTGSSSNSPSLGKWVWENSLDPSTAWAGRAQPLLALRKPRAQCPDFFPSREELELKTRPQTQLTFSTKFVFTLKCSSSIKPFTFCPGLKPQLNSSLARTGCS